jgi:hypothetical protein
MVAAFIAVLKVAVISAVGNTPVTPVFGETPVTVGTTGAAAVVNIQV